MSAGSDRFVSTSDIEPLLDIAGRGEDRRLRMEALTASASLPLDAAAAEAVGEIVLHRLRTERELPGALIAAAGILPVPEVRAVLDHWAADRTSPHHEAAGRSLATDVRPPAPSAESPPVPVAAGARELSAAVRDGLLGGSDFPADLSPLATLPKTEARELLTSLVSTLIAAMDSDDDTLAAATERLGLVVQALPTTAVAALQALPERPSGERDNWLGALLTLVPPATVLSAVYRRLDTEDSSGQLNTLRQLTRAAPHLGRPPLNWPPPREPGTLASVTLLLRPKARGVRRAGDEPAPPYGRPRAPVAPSPAPDGGRREAYARLDAPRRVPPAHVFELRVGLSPTPSPEVSQPTSLTVPAGEFLLDVEILAPGFEVVGGDPLSVRMKAGPDDLYPYQLRRLRATDDDAFAAERVITAVYSVSGRVIGVAHRTVLVGEGPEDAVAAQVSEEPAGITWVLPDDPATQPDLEIIVAPGNDAEGTRLCWLYRSPHRQVRPAGKTPGSRLGGEAEWARSAMRSVQDRKDASDLPSHLRGIGFDVSEAVPLQVWEALRAAARVTNPPTVLIATWDPYVPWELAMVPEPWDTSIPAHLGAQATVGRWTYKDQIRTAAPPARLTARTMAVVTGDYPTSPLEQAAAEADHLITEYRAESVDALTDPVLGGLGRKVGAPDILHFAVHGKFDAAESEDGIMMTDGSYLSRQSVRGVETSLVRLVFLNACQLGQSRKALGSYAGMVPAFVGLGIGAAVAPLWNVDDGVAREFAQGFYKAALKGKTAPAEYLRRQRAATQGASGAGVSTPLAYLFYGHPRLTIEWDQEGADDV
ncbi:CHAT domain-containing protein [Streptomyces sp. ISL-44]|uniref:CHAT domain-containing protein n=1 Tax=Streptomyces sp. ISL-44 TaxID=2819184 RepID=UPI001BE532F8|nr:CHAT domain-containing protein [Streptomyces sp. ISL-44]MBT2539794.1 CHAT domain-containing protein [Streptomyces sp. ISL-44]